MKKLPVFIGVALLLETIASVTVYATWHGKKSYPVRWDARVLPIVSFVEDHRGLTFKHPVSVRFLTDSAFVNQVKSPPETAQDRKDTEQYLEELRALGLVSGHPDLFKAENDFVSADVVGLYLPEKKTLYVRGTELTPYVRTTIAHELTHALQDQYFDLKKIEDNAPDASVARVLIEGDAVRIQNEYEDDLSTEDKQAYDKTQSSYEDSASSASTEKDIPTFLQDANEYPYVFGPTYLDSLVADGGNDRVNAAFRHPPVTDAQVVDPRDYPLTFAPRKLPQPALPAGAKAIDKPTPFGQVGVLEVLGSAEGYVQAWGAVQGWRGDTSLDYQLNGKSCVALDVAMSGGPAAKVLEMALRTWRATIPTARVTLSGAIVSVRSCDPGDNHKARSIAPRPFEVLGGRAQLIHVLVAKASLGFNKATCISDRVLATVGVRTFMSAADSPEVGTVFRRAFEEAAARC